MKVQRMCKKLVLLLLLAALLCQTALAVDSEFLYGQRDISWIGMEGDSFLKLDGNAADRNHPSAAPGYWLDVYIPLVVDISSDCVLQDVTVEALEPESSYEYNQWPYSIRDFEADCAKFRSSTDWRVQTLYWDDQLNMDFKIPVPSGTQSGIYNLYFKITADFYDANSNLSTSLAVLHRMQ